MKTNWNNSLSRLTGILAAVVFLTACDSSSAIGGDDFAAESFDDSISLLAVDLGLTPGETAALTDSFAKFGSSDPDGDHEPGFLWQVAAELQATLTDDQKARIFARLEKAGAQRRRGQSGQSGQGGPGQGGHGRFRPGSEQGGGHGGGAFSEIDLTAEQQAAIILIRESFKPEIEAIIAQRETLTREEIMEALAAIHDQVKTEVNAVLTAEQLQQLEDLKAAAEAARVEREAQQELNREAAKLVMIEVLGLTTDQATALDDLKASAEAARQAIQDLRDSGATQEEVQAAAEALREANEAALAGILDATQLEITKIHRALTLRKQNRRHQNGQGGFPGQGGPRGRRSQGGPGFGAPGFGSLNSTTPSSEAVFG